jgi:hypothetical protein
MRFGSAPFLASLLLLVSCGERAGETGSPRAADTPAAGSVGPGPGTADSLLEQFDRNVYNHYARLAVDAPRQVVDSIIHSGTPAQVQERMKAYFRRRDTLTRQTLATYYTLTLDSLDAIIARGNAERW